MAHGSAAGFVLISVLVVVATALLVVTSLLFITQAEVARSSGTAQRVQARALALSGLQAVMIRLDEQRETVLGGDVPRVDEEYVIYESGARLGVARLLPVGPDDERLIPEPGKLDLNRADADMLADTDLLDPELAERIIEHRDQLGRPFQSLGELLEVPGMTPEALYGPIEELTVMDDAMLADSESPRRRLSQTAAPARGLADVLTVYSVEPALQQSGTRRINLNVPYSEELGRRVDRRFGTGSSETLRQIFDSGTTFENDAKIIQVLRFFNMSPEDWPEIIDAFTTDPGDYHFGRLDINTAPYEALVAQPGFDAEQAAQIVRVRDTLPSDERATIAWPAIRGIVEPEAYDELAGRITTRSWTYRIRIAAGEVVADDAESALINPVIYEAVIDLAAPKARVAYLRDISLLQVTARVAANAPPDEMEADGELPDPELNETGDPWPDDEADLASADSMGGDDLDDGFASADAANDPETAASSPVEESSRRIGRWLRGD
ncbi:MAG: ComEA family DNA-binding protein [Planctomycetota bacterium]|jgi:DNA uptake protein ComE-like DNA-binding protein